MGLCRIRAHPLDRIRTLILDRPANRTSTIGNNLILRPDEIAMPAHLRCGVSELHHVELEASFRRMVQNEGITIRTAQMSTIGPILVPPRPKRLNLKRASLVHCKAAGLFEVHCAQFWRPPKQLYRQYKPEKYPRRRKYNTLNVSKRRLKY